MEDLDLEDDMATSSINHNFIFRGHEVAERLAKILEESANDPPRPISQDFKYLQDPDELREFMEKRRAMLAAKAALEKEE